jgi:hypothetical protein
MIVGNMILKAKVVKQSLWRRLRSHHRSALLANHQENGITAPRPNQAPTKSTQSTLTGHSAIRRCSPHCDAAKKQRTASWDNPQYIG